MTRYFAAAPHIEQAVRTGVMQALGQPNGYADSPWSPGGDFTCEGQCYVALEPHHTDGEAWSALLSAALQSGVREITAEQYHQALLSLASHEEQ